MSTYCWLFLSRGGMRSGFILSGTLQMLESLDCLICYFFFSYAEFRRSLYKHLYIFTLFGFYILQTLEPAILPPLKEIYPGNMNDDLTGSTC